MTDDDARREYNRRQKAARRARTKPVEKLSLADRIADKTADRIADIVRAVVREELGQNPRSEAADRGTEEPKRSEGFGSSSVSPYADMSASASAPLSASALDLPPRADDMTRARVKAANAAALAERQAARNGR